MQRNFKNQNEKHLVEFVCKFRPKNIWERCKAWRIGNSGGSTQARKKERRCPSFCTEHETSNLLCYPNKTIGYAHQPTKAIIMFCIHNYLGGLLFCDADKKNITKLLLIYKSIGGVKTNQASRV